MGRDALMSSKLYTRGEAVSILEALLAEFIDDHEEYTGISDSERMILKDWWQEIMNLLENTS